MNDFQSQVLRFNTNIPNLTPTKYKFSHHWAKTRLTSQNQP